MIYKMYLSLALVVATMMTANVSGNQNSLIDAIEPTTEGDCTWYTQLKDTDPYDSLFDSDFLSSLDLSERCAYAAAVRDFETYLESNVNSTVTGTALAPLLLRQAFHSAGTFDERSNTGGSNGGTLRFEEELEDKHNMCVEGATGATLAAIEGRVDIVSHADAIVLGAYVALRQLCFPRLDLLKFKGGRFDTPWLIVYRNRMPGTDSNSVYDIFVERMGMTEQEAVALVGGAQ